MMNESFTAKDKFDYQLLIDEAIETVLTADIELSAADGNVNGSIERIIEPLRKLKQAQAIFAPKLTTLRLDESEFIKRGFGISPSISKWMNEHQFFLVQVPITLKPAFGWSFVRMECWVGFDLPDAKIHDLYPDDDWTEILCVNTSFDLGIDENLLFKASVGLEQIDSSFHKIGATAKAKIGINTDIDGQMRFLVGPFEYKIWRSNIMARGRENSEAFWQLDGDTSVQKQEPYIAMILRVPNNVRKINADGALVAYHDFNFGGAHLKDFWGDFREKLRSFFTSGIPIEKRARWENIIGE